MAMIWRSLVCECKGSLLRDQVWASYKCVTLSQCYLITGSVLKLKRQDNLTDLMLNENETIVSVITGMKTK